jgi:hypothetical protein
MATATRISVLALALAISPALASAGGTGPALKYDARAKAEYGPVFTQVLQKFIASRPGLNICLPPLFGFGDTVSESVDVNADLESGVTRFNGDVGRLAQLRALESVGLVTETESTRTANGKTLRILSFRRTAKGEAVSQGPAVCYARGELDRIVKWKGPVAFGEYQAAFVYYTVKTTHIEDWARNADVQAAFPLMVPIVKGDDTKVRQVVVDLSSEGWDIAEYSKYVQLQ